MRFGLVLLAVAIVHAGVALAQSGNVTQERTRLLKSVSTPPPAYPDEARKNGIEGKVALKIVVDARGRVLQATAVSGPAELIPAAVAAVNEWQFEPPASAPFIATVEVSFGFPRECPGPESDSGNVETNGRLVDRDGKVVATYDDDFKNDLSLYPEESRKAGVSGELVLLITLSATARLQEVRIFKSLSPSLDQAALNAARSWRFKRFDPNSKAPLDNLRLVFRFAIMCSGRF